MKKPLFITFFLCSCLSLFAQNNPPLLQDFVKGVKNGNAFAFNDHLNIMQVSTDDDKFDLIAINDKMQVVWKTSLAGYSIKTDKFKGKVIALAATDHSALKGNTNIFIAYSVEPETGKVIATKEVYHSTNEYFEIPQLYTGNGSMFKLAVRQTSYPKKLRWAIPYTPFVTGGPRTDQDYTRSLQVIEYDEKLDSLKSFKPVMSKGNFVSLDFNTHGDMFVSWLNGPSIEIYKYDAGKTAPSNMMTAPVTFKVNMHLDASGLVYCQPSENRDVIYYGMTYSNPNKDVEVGIGKFNFNTNKQSFVTQVYDKAYLKKTDKSFVPENKDVDDMDLGKGNWMSLRYIGEANDRLVTIVSARTSFSSSLQYGGYMEFDYSFLLNIYDKDLNLKGMAVLPGVNKYRNKMPSPAFRMADGKLYVVRNATHGQTSNYGIMAVLNLKDGKWDKMVKLSDKHLDSDQYADGPSMLWYGNNVIVPFYNPKFINKNKFDITLQQNMY